MSRDYHDREIKKWEKVGDYMVPKDEWGHYLNCKIGLVEFTGMLEAKTLPTEAEDLTSPYGSLEYAVGSGDDFYCFDHGMLPDGRVVLHATLNSETGHFIEDCGYEVVPKDEAPKVAEGLCDMALEWCAENGVRPGIKGWNQDPFYFARKVAHDCGTLGRPLKRREPPKRRLLGR